MIIKERKKGLIFRTAFLSIFLIIVLAACGGSSSYNSARPAQSAEAKSTYEEAYSEDYAAGEAAYEMTDTASGTEKGNGGEETAVEAAESDQKLVYTCSMEIQTLTFSETAQKVREMIRQYNGIIESESTTDSDYEWYRNDGFKKQGTLSTYLVIRIPTEKYEDFLKSLEGAGGKITNRSMDVQNITRVYNDQTVYIESLEKQEARLLQMMEQAQTIEEMITVEERLTEVQTELNQARSRLSGMDTDVAYSTISLSLQEVVKYTDTTVKKTFFERTGAVISESFSGFLRTLELLLDIIIYLLPYIVLFGGIALIILFATKKQRAARRQEREEMRKQMRAREPYGFGRGRRPNGPQGNGAQGNGLQGNRPQGNGPQGNGPQGNRPQGNGPQGNGPQGNGPQGNGPQGNGPQGNGPQGNGPQGNGPQGNGPQVNDPQGKRPQANAPQVNNPQMTGSQKDSPQGAASRPDDIGNETP